MTVLMTFYLISNLYSLVRWLWWQTACLRSSGCLAYLTHFIGDLRSSLRSQTEGLSCVLPPPLLLLHPVLRWSHDTPREHRMLLAGHSSLPEGSLSHGAGLTRCGFCYSWSRCSFLHRCSFLVLCLRLISELWLLMLPSPSRLRSWVLRRGV